MIHFAEAGIALVVAGASILTIAGLVRESLREGGGNLHLFPDAHGHGADDDPELHVVRLSETSTTDDAGVFVEAHDPSGLPEADPAETMASNHAGPFPHPRGSGRRSKKDSPPEDRAARKQRKEKRRSKKLNGTDGGADTGIREEIAEAENA